MKFNIIRRYKWSLISMFIIISLYLSANSLDDNLIYGKKGKNFCLPELFALTDCFIKPIESNQNYSFTEIDISKYKAGISGNGSFNVKNNQLLHKMDCEIIMFPAIEQTYLEIKLSEGNYFEQKKSMKIYPFQKAFLAPYLGNLLNTKMDLICVDYQLFLLNYNSLRHPYFLREKYNKDLIEKQLISNGVHFKVEEVARGYKNGFTISLINSKDQFVQRNIIEKLNQLNEIFKNDSFEQLDQVFDLKYLSQYFLYSAITGRNKLSNTRWVYRLTNGKIYPIASAHKTFNKFKVDKQSVWQLILKNHDFKKLLLDWNLNNDNLPSKKEIQKVVDKYAPFLSKYKKNMNITQRELNYRLRKDGHIMQSNIDLLRKFIGDMKLGKTYKLQRKLECQIIQEIDNLGFIINKSKIIVKKGVYKIDKNIIFPKGYNLILDAGVELQMDCNASIIVNGEIHVLGTKTEKVIIKGSGIKPFGVVAAIGDGRQNSIIEHLDISNGSEIYIDGKYLSGALCFYHQNVVVNNLRCHSNKADDGLNIKYGNILVKNSYFYDNWADQVDIDFCKGKIENCIFSCDNGDTNGDGLDLSGSQIHIKQCSFNKFKDKGLSVGEKSIVKIVNSSFKMNTNAISVKDLSNVTVLDNLFQENGIAFNLYMKKKIFGGGFLNLGNNTFQNNIQQLKKDSISKIKYINKI